jgi:hypothetical protein
MMARIADLVRLLAQLSGLPPDVIERCARHLKDAGLLPAAQGALTSERAATLLLAVMGSRSPIEAVEAARVYMQLPFSHMSGVRMLPDGSIRSYAKRAGDPGGEAIPELKLPFADVLAMFIDTAIDGEGSRVDAISVLRRPAAPVGTIHPKTPEGEMGEFHVFYMLPEAQEIQGVEPRMSVCAHIPGSALVAIKQLIAE